MDDSMELSFGHGTSSDENAREEQNDVGIDMGNQSREKVDESYKRIIELTCEDILGLVFDTEGEAIDFYHKYSKCHGFVMRRDDVSRDLRGNINMRQLVCNKEGKRSEKHLQRLDRVREHKPLTRTGCQAKIRFHRDYKTRKWKVVAFEESHNHELIPSSMVHLLPAYRGLSDVDKAQVNSLQSHGVRICHIMGYMVAQKGGYGHVGFTKKDLYNHIDRNRRAQVADGDANAALSYLWAKADHDPLLQGIYTLTDDRKLLNLFWADGTSLIDYECFGDVIAFDTTYKKNKYNKPLVIFSGSNHYGHTTIFGCALVHDEKVETYKWVLEAFLEAMSNKHPKAVVTDGDGAMREAIKEVFPNATHRLCAWHLHRNACENIKNPHFLEDFKSLIYGNFTLAQFEDLWKEVMTKHELSSNKWVSKTYENKEMWATAYLRDTFFGHIRTTSQCEGINSFIKAYIRKKCSLLDFMHNFQNALREYRNNELIADFSCMFSAPVMTTCLQEIEKHASKVYTRDIFKEVKSQLEDAGAVNVIERLENGDNVVFKMNIFRSLRMEYQVRYDKSCIKFLCDCRLFESRGIPCCHILCAMKHDHIDSLPSSLICKRWRKDAKCDYIRAIPAEASDAEKVEMLRIGALGSVCDRLRNLACKRVEDFIEIRDDLFKLIFKLEIRHDAHRKNPYMPNVVQDPTIVKTKGAPSRKKYGRKKWKCSHCKKSGHTIRKCPLLFSMDDSMAADQDISSSDSDKIINEFDDSSKYGSQTVYGSHSHKTGTIEKRDGNNDQSGEDTKIAKLRRVGSSKRLPKESICPTQNSVKDSGKKVTKSERRNTDVKGTEIEANVTRVNDGCVNSGGSTHTMNYDFLNNSHGMAVFPPYPGIAVIPQFPRYPPYGGVPMYPPYPPYYTGTNTRISSGGVSDDNGVKKKR